MLWREYEWQGRTVSTVLCLRSSWWQVPDLIAATKPETCQGLRGADTRVCGVETRLDALLCPVPSVVWRWEHPWRILQLGAPVHRDESRCGSLKAAPQSHRR